MKTKTRKRKSETEKYIERLDERLNEIDYSWCIQIAEHEIEEDRYNGFSDDAVVASYVHELFGINEYDLCALADKGELKAIRRNHCSDVLFELSDLIEFFQRREDCELN